MGKVDFMENEIGLHFREVRRKTKSVEHVDFKDTVLLVHIEHSEQQYSIRSMAWFRRASFVQVLTCQ